MALILHPLHFDEETDNIVVVQAAVVLGQERGRIARWDGDCLDEAFEHEHPTRETFVCDLVEAVYDADTAAMEALEERVDDCEFEVLDSDGHGTYGPGDLPPRARADERAPLGGADGQRARQLRAQGRRPREAPGRPNGGTGTSAWSARWRTSTTS